MHRKLFNGFTLIELLITITLIGILSGIVGLAMVNPQKLARDAKRKSDLELIRSGLEIYNADCGSYPTSSSPVLFSLPSSTSLSGSGTCANTYIVTVPKDAKSAQNYSYVSGGATYSLCAILEMTPNPTPDPNGPIKNCNCGTSSCNYVVTNP